MNTFATLLRREWLQHRFGWTMLALGPMTAVLLLVLLPFVQINVDVDRIENAGPSLPALLAIISIVATMIVSAAVLWFAALLQMMDVARRDHADRSIEFWRSLPVSHSQSLAAPLLMHLVLVPAAALLVGLAGGYLMSLAIVTRIAGFSAWLSVPWSGVFAASLALAGRMMVGLPLAMLWLAPLVLLVVLSNALLRRWGVAVLLIALAFLGLALEQTLGQPLLGDLLRQQTTQAAQAFLANVPAPFRVEQPGDVITVLAEVPRWAAADLAGAVRALASPAFIGGLLLAAALFALLVQWRRRVT